MTSFTTAASPTSLPRPVGTRLWDQAGADRLVAGRGSTVMTWTAYLYTAIAGWLTLSQLTALLFDRMIRMSSGARLSRSASARLVIASRPGRALTGAHVPPQPAPLET